MEQKIEPERLNDSAETEGPSNLTVCPNCLEPNTDDLAVCRYCGMPLHPGAEPDPTVMPETEEEMAANRAEAAPEENKDPKKTQQSGFQRVMPWLGVYLIYYAITGCFDVKRQVAAAAEAGQPINEKLAYLTQVIWFIAGLLMAWPLVKKGYRKLRHLPEEDETPVGPQEATETSENSGETPAEEPEAAESTEDHDWEVGEEYLSEPDALPEPEENAEFPEDASSAEDPDDSEFEEDGEAAKWL